ncbi:MAG: class I SAM-dependent methyltransferase [Oscillospiraceae bacterium]|jgi:23S rRNA (cytosine1962-C5)-methyltransferase|nr:class I SAM-dependent methyltransferase [Oscillospiraceae bacterium]
MRVADGWKQYRILDASDGEKLEDWNGICLIRPDPQIIWKTPYKSEKWQAADGHYIRSSAGGGQWQFRREIPKDLTVSYMLGKKSKLTFAIKPMNFKHTGLFPEQAVNWEFMYDRITDAGREINVLNLFAYTGGATLACAAAGATVCHVDASKGMITHAKLNAELSGLSDKPIRWIVDDCEKFIRREIKRGRKYDVIIMDPPSYGRGPGGEVWKLEECIYELVCLAAELLSENPLFFLINSYTSGLSASVMGYILAEVTNGRFAAVLCDEIGLPVETGKMPLPCGATAQLTVGK